MEGSTRPGQLALDAGNKLVERRPELVAQRIALDQDFVLGAVDHDEAGRAQATGETFDGMRVDDPIGAGGEAYRLGDVGLRRNIWVGCEGKGWNCGGESGGAEGAGIGEVGLRQDRPRIPFGVETSDKWLRKKTKDMVPQFR